MYQTLIKPLFADVKTFVLDTLFPVYCLRCNTEGSFICAGCLSVLERLEHQHCIVCQKPSIMGFTHPGCLTPHGADGLISILNYHDEDVANIIIKGKYNFLPSVFQGLGKFLANEVASGYPLLTTQYTLVPLPLHKRRLHWRGFNQAEILCQAISAELDLPILDALVRVKSTKTQKDLKRDQRIKNIKDAFALSPSPLLFKVGVAPEG
jgi:predicted amidophosphoribosyltransferase